MTSLNATIKSIPFLNFSVKFKDSVKEKVPFNAVDLIHKSIFLKGKFGCHLDIEWVSKGNNIINKNIIKDFNL